MPVYAYTARNAVDERATGTLVADTPGDGRRILRERGLRIDRFDAASRNGSVRFTWYSRSRRQDQVAELARYLALLLRAGVPLTQGLEVLAQQKHGAVITVLKDLRDRVTGGDSFAEALSAHGQWFDRLFVSAVRVGEMSGRLDESLMELAEHLRTRQHLRQQVTSALTYPLILLCLGVAVVLFLMTYVIPQLMTVLQATGGSLPASTQLLKTLSDAILGHWLLLLLVTASLLAGGWILLQRDAGRRVWQSTQLRLPIVGPLIRKQIVSEFAQRMALLLRTGIPFVEAARSMADLSRNLILRDELTAMAKAVESGSDIAPTMADSRVFPPVVVHLVAVGQDSGELPAMLAELRDRYEHEVRIALGKFTAALEPLLIILLASVVGFVVFACMMPILEATRGIA